MRPRSLLLPLLLAPCLAPQAQELPPIDPRHFDTSVAACTDFHRHVNGGWLDTHPVPRGSDSIGLFDQLEQQHRQRELALLRALAADPARAGEPLADFIASGLDAAAVEAAGAGPLDALLGQLDKLSAPPKQVPALLDTLQSRGLPVAFRIDVTEIDGKRLPILHAGGLGLPDRDYYLRQDPAARELLGRYRAYVEQLLALVGSADPATDAAWVLDVEMRLARGWIDTATATPPAVLSISELRKRYPSLDWRGWQKAHGLKRADRFAIASPAFFSELDTLVSSGHPVQWRAWLRFRVAHLLAPFLGARFVELHDSLFERTLRGRSEPLERAERVLQSTSRVLASSFDQAMLQRYLPAEDRAAVERLVEAQRNALRAALPTVAWVPDEARGELTERLDKLSVEIAEPASEGVPDGLRFDRGRYLENVLKAAAALQKQRLDSLDAGSKAALPAPRGTPPLAGQYDPRSNKLQIGLALLQPPLFQPQSDPALTHGALGALIGHELIHAVDLAGAAWAGRTPDAARIDAWQTRTAPLVTMYDGLQSAGQPIDGTRTLAENAADLGGLELAWRTFSATHDLRLPEQHGLTPAQRFFVGWAQMWRRNARDSELQRLLQNDLQAPAEWRVNAPLSQLAAFSDAWACKPGQPMRRHDAERVQLFD